jgi:hypothetical protein
MFAVSAEYFTKQNTNVKACELALMAFFLCEVWRLDACICGELAVDRSGLFAVIRLVGGRNVDVREPAHVP